MCRSELSTIYYCTTVLLHSNLSFELRVTAPKRAATMHSRSSQSTLLLSALFHIVNIGSHCPLFSSSTCFISSQSPCLFLSFSWCKLFMDSLSLCCFDRNGYECERETILQKLVLRAVCVCVGWIPISCLPRFRVSHSSHQQ